MILIKDICPGTLLKFEEEYSIISSAFCEVDDHCYPGELVCCLTWPFIFGSKKNPYPYTIEILHGGKKWSINIKDGDCLFSVVGK